MSRNLMDQNVLLIWPIISDESRKRTSAFSLLLLTSPKERLKIDRTKSSICLIHSARFLPVPPKRSVVRSTKWIHQRLLLHLLYCCLRLDSSGINFLHCNSIMLKLCRIILVVVYSHLVCLSGYNGCELTYIIGY